MANKTTEIKSVKSRMQKNPTRQTIWVLQQQPQKLPCETQWMKGNPTGCIPIQVYLLINKLNNDLGIKTKV